MTDAPAAPRYLVVSSVLGGDSALVRTVDRQLKALARAVAAADAAESGGRQGDAMDEVLVDVTYHVPGPILSPDYVGLRTGSWVGRSNRQIVQVAVPSDLAPEQTDDFLVSSLVEAVGIAASHLAKRRSQKSVAVAAEVAERVRARFPSDGDPGRG